MSHTFHVIKALDSLLFSCLRTKKRAENFCLEVKKLNKSLWGIIRVMCVTKSSQQTHKYRKAIICFCFCWTALSTNLFLLILRLYTSTLHKMCIEGNFFFIFFYASSTLTFQLAATEARVNHCETRVWYHYLMSYQLNIIGKLLILVWTSKWNMKEKLRCFREMKTFKLIFFK